MAYINGNIYDVLFPLDETFFYIYSIIAGFRIYTDNIYIYIYIF